MFTDFALEFVRQRREKPFFLYLAWTIPHGKYQIPSLEPYADQKWEHDYKVHAAMVTRMDSDVGRLLALLKELKIDDRTPAQARIAGDQVIVSSPEVPKPVAARYAWENNPVCNLYNGAGLPASPFGTDEWK